MLRASTGLLASAANWKPEVDLGNELKFLGDIAMVTLRPDLVLTSDCSKQVEQVVMLKLIVLWDR